jgi:hypothetical protein
MTHLEDKIRHEHTVEILFDRLMNNGLYDSIQKHVIYHRKHLMGECDVVTKRNGITNYYEVKGHYCRQSLDHARHQFERYKTAHPNERTRFIYVSPQHVERIRI